MNKQILALMFLPLFASCGTKEILDFNLTKNNSVGTVTLYSFNGDSERVPGTINLGHAFISVKNTTSQLMKVGAFTLEPNEEVSVGGWGQTAHFGMWYNIESTYMKLGRYQGIISITTEFVTEDLIKLNEYIKTHDQWSLFKNCSYMALDMYNTVANEEDKISVGKLVTPGKLYDKLKNSVDSVFDRQITYFTKVGYSANYEMTELVEFELK